MFKPLGALVLCYVVYCLYTERVFAKRGPWGRMVGRGEGAFAYWSALACYALLGVAMMTVF